MKKINICGKTSPESYRFIDDIKWENKTTMSRILGLAIDFILKYHKNDFIGFVKKETQNDRIKYIEER